MGPPLEVGGEYDWAAIADSLADLVAPERTMDELRKLAARLEGLDECLAARGVPARILNMPAVGLRTLDTRLKRWGLLQKKHYSDDREAALVGLLKRFYACELTDGQLLRTLRRDVLGLNQTRYATLVGISRPTLSDLEGDKSNVTLEVKNRVYRPLGLEVSLLPCKHALLERALIPTE